MNQNLDNVQELLYDNNIQNDVKEEINNDIIQNDVKVEINNDNIQNDVKEEINNDNIQNDVKEEINNDNIKNDVKEEINNDNIQNDVKEEINNDNIQNDVKEEINNDNIQNDIKEEIKIIKPLFERIPPKYVFVVPYRDREKEKDFFINHMNYILENYDRMTYKILFVHQMDKRSFNRGGMKNIGFIATKMQYPNEYKNITFVFNDVDTMPKKKGIINYDTIKNKVKHFYGFRFSLGGIFSIKGEDFEKCNGFPNFFGYAYEDNLLYKRCQNNGINIDRSNFFKIGDFDNIIQTNNSGPYRNIRRSEFDRFMDNTNEGIYQIFKLLYTIEPINNNSGFINVHRFHTLYPDNPSENILYDIRITSQPFKPTRKQIRKSIQPHLKINFI